MFDWIGMLFKDETGQASMSRLLLFFSFVVGSYILIEDTHKNGLNEVNYGIYLSAFAGSYVGGKFAEGIGNMRRKNNGGYYGDNSSGVDNGSSLILTDGGDHYGDGADAGRGRSDVSGRGL